jgi:hypothetical protein
MPHHCCRCPPSCGKRGRVNGRARAPSGRRPCSRSRRKRHLRPGSRAPLPPGNTGLYRGRKRLANAASAVRSDDLASRLRLVGAPPFRTSTALRGPKSAWNHPYPHGRACAARSQTYRFAGNFEAVGVHPESLKIVVSPVRVWVSPFLKGPACGLLLCSWRRPFAGGCEGRLCARGPFQVLNLRGERSARA